MIANGFYAMNHPDPAYTAAWERLDQVFEAIGRDNYYAFMQAKFPNGASFGRTWAEVERIAAAKLASVTPEECNCNGVNHTCAVCRTKWLDAETLEIELPF